MNERVNACMHKWLSECMNEGMVNTLMQAKSSVTLHHSQEPHSGNRADSKQSGGNDASHDGSQGFRGDTRDLDPSSAAGVVGRVSHPPQQQPNPSGRGRGGGRSSNGEHSRGRGRGRGGHSAHPNQQPLTQGHITPPPGLALVHDRTVRSMYSHL